MAPLRALCALGFLCLQSLADAGIADGLDADMVASLGVDDECTSEAGATVCALELAQLRAAKLSKPHAHAKHEAKHKSKHEAKHDAEPSADYDHPPWLKNCKKILLDIGSNIGVNIRKLYEPKKYDGATVLPLFEKYFGEPAWRRTAAGKSGVCALGFEPNAEHFERLQAIEKAYNDNSWHVHFYPFAAWSSEGKMVLNKTGSDEKFVNTGDLTKRGAHLSMEQDSKAKVSKRSLVRTVNLGDFVSTLPDATVQLMLMDIEGAEYDTLAQMMMDKKLCRNKVQHLLIETHSWGDISRWGNGSSFKKGVQPRSMVALHERVSQMGKMKWCGDDNVTSVAKFDDDTFPKDVDDNFGVIQR